MGKYFKGQKIYVSCFSWVDLTSSSLNKLVDMFILQL